jgi:hypothetical protein
MVLLRKFKARLVKDLRQQEGVDYFNTYSYVSRITSIQMLIFIIVIKTLEIYQNDVKNNFF